MKYSPLGKTDLKVSRICLGSMNWGQQNTEKEAYEQLDYAVSQGVNFVDTAEVYPIPPSPLLGGVTESFIGNWLEKRGKRHDLIIASKVVGRSFAAHLRRGWLPRLDKKNIKFAIDKSLQRLKTDYIDLYQVHWPDRKTNYFGQRGYVHDPKDRHVPIEETLEAMQELIRIGKIRYVGVSNETAWGLMEYLRLHREKNLPQVQSIQNPYSLIMREYETALSEISIRERVSLLVYSPLAYSVLTGKYLGGKLPQKSRFGYSMRNSDRYNPPHAQPAIKAYMQLAKKYGLDPAQMAIAFVLSREFVTSVIVGATTLSQLKSDIASIDTQLSKSILKEVDHLHRIYPNPIS